MVKLAIGSIGDSFSAVSVKSYLAEFIATLLFVFAGVGSAIAYGMIHFFLKPYKMKTCVNIITIKRLNE